MHMNGLLVFFLGGDNCVNVVAGAFLPHSIPLLYNIPYNVNATGCSPTAARMNFYRFFTAASKRSISVDTLSETWTTVFIAWNHPSKTKNAQIPVRATETGLIHVINPSPLNYNQGRCFQPISRDKNDCSDRLLRTILSAAFLKHTVLCCWRAESALFLSLNDADWRLVEVPN